MPNSQTGRKTESVERKTVTSWRFAFSVVRLVTWLAPLLALSACGVHQADKPGLTGPSELALSLRITATPDSINRDGGSQSSIQVVAQDASAKPVVGLSVRVDIKVDGTFQDFGTLSARTVVTGSDGKANLVYTAPPPAPANSTIQATCGTMATTGELNGQCVEITAAPMGTNLSTAQSQFVEIRLVPPGVIQPPADTPTPKFTVSPTSPAANLPVQFDASTSTPGSGNPGASASTITSYVWDFGDRTQGTGRIVTHTYTIAGAYNVTLTVTNDRTISASTTQAITVGAGGLPIPSFTFSPTAPRVDDTVFFNGSASTAGAGHTITSYKWSFGDGGTASGSSATNAYSDAGTYTVLLTLTDEAGQSNSVSQTVTVAAIAPPVASFTFSPTQPGINSLVFFNGTTSTAAPGHTIRAYNWTFGDGTTGVGATTSHSYHTAGTYNVQLTVTDDTGETVTSGPQGVTVTTTPTVPPTTPTPPTARFTFSPAAPGVGEQVNFSASSSTPGVGHTIVSYSWNFGDSSTGTGVTVSHPFAPAGSYLVQLTVTDEIGQTNTSAAQTVTVGNPPTPTANFTSSPTGPAVGQPVVFDASSSTTAQGQTITRLDWNFGDGTPIVTCPGDPACNGTRIISHVFSAPATYTVNLVVTDSAGRTGSRSGTVTVGSNNPIARLTLTKTGGLSIVADGSQSTPAPFGTATITTYTFNWGDFSPNTSGAPATATHTYAQLGSYTVTLTVTDNFSPPRTSAPVTQTIIVP